MQLTKCPLNAIVYRLIADEDDPDRYKCRWADFTLEFDFRRLSIRSDSGDYSYSWGHSDTDSLLNLLSRVSKEYLMSKISEKNIFDVKASKERLIEHVKYNAESYGIENIDEIISDINDISDVITEESYLLKVKHNIIPKIDWESIPVEKAYPYNIQIISEIFIKHVQPQIKEDFEAKKKVINVYYTVDNEQIAIDEVKSSIKRIKDATLLSLKVEDSKRACRNANGKEITEEEFDEIEPNEDDAWFDDYDFTFKAEIETYLSMDELLKACEKEGLSVDKFKEGE